MEAPREVIPCMPPLTLAVARVERRHGASASFGCLRGPGTATGPRAVDRRAQVPPAEYASGWRGCVSRSHSRTASVDEVARAAAQHTKVGARDVQPRPGRHQRVRCLRDRPRRRRLGLWTGREGHPCREARSLPTLPVQGVHAHPAPAYRAGRQPITPTACLPSPRWAQPPRPIPASYHATCPPTCTPIPSPEPYLHPLTPPVPRHAGHGDHRAAQEVRTATQTTANKQHGHRKGTACRSGACLCMHSCMH